MVRHLVEAQGGRVRGESRGVGQGATFTVTFPLLSAPLDLAERRLSPKDASVPALRGARVLVIDDDYDTRDLLKTFLAQSGAQVAAAASADEALQMIAEFKPEVLVCDVGMPGMDGYSLMQKLRTEGAKIPAVAVTGYVSWEDRERARSAGYKAHLAKPVEPNDLIREVARLVERRSAA